MNQAQSHEFGRTNDGNGCIVFKNIYPRLN